MTDHGLGALLRLIRRLRSPDGCPWDQEQSLATVRSYLVEEAHEVAAALDRSDDTDGSELREELGDLLFQCCFIAVLAEEQQMFELADAMSEVHEKMIARHPHVFPSPDNTSTEQLETAKEVAAAWERRKQRDPRRQSVLDGVPHSMPALSRAYRVGQKVAGVGFDWPDVDGVLAKVDEELLEVREALHRNQPNEIEEELGDLLLSVASLARHVGLDPERALSRANHKFETRYRRVEAEMPTDRDAEADELDTLWQRAKSERRPE